MSRAEVLRNAGRPSVVLLVQTADGDPVAVRFPNREQAREWEDEHDEILAVGCVDYVSDHEALKRARSTA